MSDEEQQNEEDESGFSFTRQFTLGEYPSAESQHSD
jgi:hypothetical protein